MKKKISTLHLIIRTILRLFYVYLFLLFSSLNLCMVFNIYNVQQVLIAHIGIYVIAICFYVAKYVVSILMLRRDTQLLGSITPLTQAQTDEIFKGMDRYIAE